jgi:acyl carrier protein
MRKVERAEFLKHVVEMFDMPEGALTGQEKLADLDGWTSVAMMSFIAFGDEHFGKNLSPRQFAACETVADLGRLVGVTA